ncbi:MAG: hypothetical protein AABW48_05290 [Nanoarchaeota archaeon]
MKIQIINFVVLLALLIVLCGCTPIEKDNLGENNLTGVGVSLGDDSAGTPKDETAGTAAEAPKTEITGEEPTPTEAIITGSCTPGWKCISSEYKAYLNADCTFGERKRCTLRCADNDCVAGNVCTTGIKCIDVRTKGFQQEDCSWTNRVNCDYGCENNVCISSLANASAASTTAETAASSTAAATPVAGAVVTHPELKLSEVQEVTIGGLKYDLAISVLEADQVKIRLNTQKSDWISEKGSFRFGNGITITIYDIYYQTFSGGKMGVSYSIG